MTSMPLPVALADVLARGDVWRGDTLASLPESAIPSGHAELDAELPGGGWPRGNLTEILVDRSSVGEMSLLMPALAHVSASELSWVVCVAPPLPPYAPAWAAAGVALSRLLVTRAVGGDAAWACERKIDDEGVGALVAWLPESDPATLRRLQLLAEKSRTLIFLFRPAAVMRESSPAPLRIGIAAANDPGRLSLRLIKRRGGALETPLELDMARPAPLPHVVAGPSLSAAAARSLSATAVA